jgi:hypothetical protein
MVANLGGGRARAPAQGHLQTIGAAAGEGEAGGGEGPAADPGESRPEERGA